MALDERFRDFYARREAGGMRFATPGSQWLAQVLCGGHLDPALASGAGKRALDAGCGSGYNLVTLALLGYEAHGVEIGEDIADHARRYLDEVGVKATVTVGENERLPYPDGHFDLLVSMNAVHYAPSREAMRRTADEFARVLAPGGRLVASTNHPDNWIFDGAEDLGGNVVRVGTGRDFRDGETMYRFADAGEVEACFAPRFASIVVGENRTELFAKTLRNYVFTGVRRAG